MAKVVFKSYNPRILLKVIVYAYLNNVYSGRQIENPDRLDFEIAPRPEMIIP